MESNIIKSIILVKGKGSYTTILRKETTRRELLIILYKKYSFYQVILSIYYFKF
jgi:hypothetical protein